MTYFFRNRTRNDSISISDKYNWITVADNIDHEFFVVRGLEPLTEYHFRVAATNKFGTGPFSIPSLDKGTESTGMSIHSNFN